jgi:hypothetical protein
LKERLSSLHSRRLGRTSYDALVAAKEGGTLTPAQEELIAEATAMLVHRAACYYYSVSGVEDTQSGLRVNTDDNSDALSSSQLSALLKQHDTFAKNAERDFDQFIGKSKDRPERVVPLSSAGASFTQRNRLKNSRYRN